LVQLPVFEHCSFWRESDLHWVIRGGCGGMSFSVMLQICGHLAACVAKNIQPMKKACAAMAGAGFWCSIRSSCCARMQSRTDYMPE
jgi:hypothetical protein